MLYVMIGFCCFRIICMAVRRKLVGTIYIAKFLYPEYLPELHPEEVFKTWLEKYQQLHYIKGHAYPELY